MASAEGFEIDPSFAPIPVRPSTSQRMAMLAASEDNQHVLVRTTLTERFSPINAANLKRAHQALESTTARGKIVIEGWQ